MRFVYDDGGRRAAGFRGDTGDCVARAIAIATGLPYKQVYDALNEQAKGERTTRGKVGLLAATGRGSSARNGVLKPTTRRYIDSLGWTWVPTMGIGTGCTVHLHDGELPSGRLIVSVSKHLTAVIDGVIHDTHDPQRETKWDDGHVSRRCVYGYWHERTA